MKRDNTKIHQLRTLLYYISWDNPQNAPTCNNSKIPKIVVACESQYVKKKRSCLGQLLHKTVITCESQYVKKKKELSRAATA